MAIVLDNSLIKHKLTIMRSVETNTKDFRQNLDEISSLMVYETLKHIKTKKVKIITPLEETEEEIIDQDIVLIPILRAGLGMVDGIKALIPNAKIAHIGLARDEKTLEPVEYYAKFPNDLDKAMNIVLDPMLATGGSASVAIQKIKDRGAINISLACLVAAPEGVKKIEDDHPDVKIILASLDRCLNEKGYIVPGLGDAGDRLFGTK